MRKVLSFVLVLALVLSSFSMAFAADDAAATTGLSDIAGNANEQAIKVCNNLGIATGNPDGTYQPDKAVTRAEFAALITRALNIPDSALAAYTNTNFKDTAGYGWAVPYLAFCESKGIMLGDGQGNAMPGKTINTNESVTMALRAIGYTSNSAKLVGVWPSNYVTLAQTEGLYDDVAAVDTSVNKATAAQIIYNLLTVGLVQVNSDGETVSLGKSVTNAGNTTFVATTLLTANHGAVASDEVVLYEDDALINTIEYVGDFATVYRDKDDDNILAIGDILSTALVGEFESGVTAATTMSGLATAKFVADDVTYAVASGYDYYDVMMTNADEVVGATLDTTSTFTFNVKLQGKKIVELYSIEAWNESAGDTAGDADVADIADAKLLGYEFATDKSDNPIENSFELVGVDSLSKIEKDDIVYVYEDATAKEIRRVAVGTEVVEGTVEKISGDDYTVNKTVYNFADTIGANGGTPDAGDGVKLFLDAYGDVYDWESTDAEADTYAVVIATGAGVDGNRARVYDANTDDEIVYSYTTDVTFDGMLENTLVGYALNKNGKINELQVSTVSDAAAKMINAKKVEFNSVGYPVDPEAVVITVDGTAGDYEYGTSTVGKIQTDVNITQTAVSAQAILDDGVVVALVVDKVNTGKNADDVYAVCNAIDKVYDVTQDETVQNLVGFADGKALDVNTNDLITITPANYATQVALFKITYDADGYVKGIVAESAAVDGDVNAVENGNLSVQVTKGGVATWNTIADNAVVYKVTDLGDSDDQLYSLSSVTAFKAATPSTVYQIWLYETDDDEEGYDVVVFAKK